MALSVSRTPRDYLIWFRPELVQVVRWAGDPNKPVSGLATVGKLSPRTSFAEWQEMVRLQSEPWSTVDIKTGQSLRVPLLEIVLEHVDQLARERESREFGRMSFWRSSTCASLNGSRRPSS